MSAANQSIIEFIVNSPPERAYEIGKKTIMEPRHDPSVYPFYVIDSITLGKLDIPVFVMRRALKEDPALRPLIEDYIVQTRSSKNDTAANTLSALLNRSLWLNSYGAEGTIPSPKVVLALVPIYSANYPPSGIAYLKSYLEASSVSTTCVDFNIDLYHSDLHFDQDLFNERDLSFRERSKFDTLLQGELSRLFDIWADRVASFKPDVFGISAPTISNLFAAEVLAKRVKERLPHLPIVVGGASVNSSLDAYEKVEAVDYLMKGEGEKSLLRLVRSLKEGTSQEIPGLYIRSNGKFVQTASECFSPNLDDYPHADYSDFPHDLYKSRSIPIVGSRGCIGACRFCNIRTVWPGFRKRTAEYIANEMREHNRTLLTRRFLFHDSLIDGDIKELARMCDLLIEGRDRLKWSGSFRVRDGLYPELFKKMKAAGCVQLNLGIESGSEKVRKDMRKTFPKDRMDKVIRWMGEAGLQLNVMMIVGYPTETEEDFLESIRFVARNKPFIERVNWGDTCRVTKGTDLFNIDKHGITFIKGSQSIHWVCGGNILEVRLLRIIRAIEWSQENGINCGDRHFDFINNELVTIQEDSHGAIDVLSQYLQKKNTFPERSIKAEGTNPLNSSAFIGNRQPLIATK